MGIIPASQAIRRMVSTGSGRRLRSPRCAAAPGVVSDAVDHSIEWISASTTADSTLDNHQPQIEGVEGWTTTWARCQYVVTFGPGRHPRHDLRVERLADGFTRAGSQLALEIGRAGVRVVHALTLEFRRCFSRTG